MKLILAKIKSNSMCPTFYKGDVIMLNKNKSPKIGDVVGFDSKRGIPTVHRIVEINGEKVKTIADSNLHQDQEFTKKAIYGNVSMIKINDLWLAYESSKILNLQGKIIQFLSKLVIKNPKNNIFLFMRKIATHSHRLTLICFYQLKKIKQQLNLATNSRIQ